MQSCLDLLREITWRNSECLYLLDRKERAATLFTCRGTQQTPFLSLTKLRSLRSNFLRLCICRLYTTDLRERYAHRLCSDVTLPKLFHFPCKRVAQFTLNVYRKQSACVVNLFKSDSAYTLYPATAGWCLSGFFYCLNLHVLYRKVSSAVALVELKIVFFTEIQWNGMSCIVVNDASSQEWGSRQLPDNINPDRHRYLWRLVFNVSR